MPFQFSAVEPVGCHYCRYSGLFGSLCYHHSIHHSDKSLIIARQTNRKQCALCYFSGPDLVNHFLQSHELVMNADIFNPICFTPDTLTELLSMDLHRRRRCGICGAVFETDHETQEHHYNVHWNIENVTIELVDRAPNQISHLICGLCNHIIQPEHYLAHVELDQKKIQSTADRMRPVHEQEHQNQNHDTNFYHKQYQNHLRTKVVFNNGLTVYKQNLTLSEYDDGHLVEMVIRMVRNAPIDDNHT